MNLKNNLKLLISFFTLVFLTSCVQETKKQTVTFFVDAKGQENLNAISVRGSLPPLSWNQNFELNDADRDSIYTGSIVLDIPYDTIEIKFVKNDEEFELNNEPNRLLRFDSSQNTIYKATFDKN